MSVVRIATRYAKSLLDLAIEQKKLDRIKEDVESFAEVCKNRDFYVMMKSPVINIDAKRNVLNKLFGEHYDELTIGFLRILLRKNREMYLPEIAKAFLIQYRAYKHISVVKLVTAKEVSEEFVDTIRQTILDSYEPDHKLEIETKVDPELIGGFQLEYDGKMYDASLSRKLESLKKNFSENLYISQIIAR
jgi:F-type H+-transporting ATPase subunit delta